MESKTTPSSLGFFMPAEWAPHEATYVSWPKNRLTFPKSIICAVEESYCKIAAELSQGEKVKILVDSKEAEGRIAPMLEKSGAKLGNILFYRIKSADVWMRDYGPMFLLNKKGGERAAVRWAFNAWGSKYDDLLSDNGTGDMIAKKAAEEDPCLRLFSPSIVMEGGSIDVNGEGALITTEQCLLNRNRNPSLGREEIEQYLQDYLGANDIVWLKEGIDGDDTDGHVDDFARFVGERKVVCAREKEMGGPNFSALENNAALLSDAGFEVIGLPMPAPIADSEDNRLLPASYANFYIGNGIVLMPAFNDKNDAVAQSILEGCFPGRKVAAIPCRGLVHGYGGIHCVTQQEPKSAH